MSAQLPTTVLKIVLVGAAALLAAWLAIQSALLQSPTGRKLGALVWESHPKAAMEHAFSEIGQAAARGRAPDRATLSNVRSVLHKAPLSAEPLLVEAASALSQGETRRGEDLLVEALHRDPRSMAAHFVLADLYLRQGRTASGLSHVAALMRRMRGAAAPLSPAIAEFAKQPGAVPHVRRVLLEDPQLRSEVLASLAADPANERVVLELSRGEPVSRETPLWHTRLLAGLISQERFEQAHLLWAQLSRVRPDPQQMLFNPGFEPSSAAPPFNWTLATGAAGVAEPTPGGGLQVLFYGRENTDLASQTLVLKPGGYRLRSEVAKGSPTSALEWVVTCLPGKRILGRQYISEDNLHFTVPVSSCAGQQLNLQGSMSDAPSTVEATIRRVTLTKVASR